MRLTPWGGVDGKSCDSEDGNEDGRSYGERRDVVGVRGRLEDDEDLGLWLCSLEVVIGLSRFDADVKNEDQRNEDAIDCFADVVKDHLKMAKFKMIFKLSKLNFLTL